MSRAEKRAQALAEKKAKKKKLVISLSVTAAVIIALAAFIIFMCVPRKLSKLVSFENIDNIRVSGSQGYAGSAGLPSLSGRQTLAITEELEQATYTIRLFSSNDSNRYTVIISYDNGEFVMLSSDYCTLYDASFKLIESHRIKLDMDFSKYISD